MIIDRRGSRARGIDFTIFRLGEIRERNLFGQSLYTFHHQFVDTLTGLQKPELFTVRTKSIGQHANDRIGDTMLSIVDAEGQRVGIITGKWGEVVYDGKQIFYGLQAHNGVSDYEYDIPDPRPIETTWGKFVSRHNARDEFGIEMQRDVPGVVAHAIVGLVTGLRVIFDSSVLMTRKITPGERRGRPMYDRIHREYSDIVEVIPMRDPATGYTKFWVDT